MHLTCNLGEQTDPQGVKMGKMFSGQGCASFVDSSHELKFTHSKRVCSSMETGYMGRPEY
jgi:hypothetical protein